MTVDASGKAVAQVDAIALRLRDMGDRVSKLKTTALRVAALACIEACANYTPVRSGNLLSNWYIGANGLGTEYDDRLKKAYEKRRSASGYRTEDGKTVHIPPPDANRVEIQEVVMQRAEEAALEIDRDKNVSRVTVYNNTPYAPSVDNGSSRNTPHGMSEAGRAAAGVAIASFQYGIAQEDYAYLQPRATKIGRRRTGE